MKTISTLLLTLSILVAAQTAKAGATYNVTSNSNWSTFAIPSNCSNCTINISAGKTLTVDEGVTCQNCTITGGNLTMGKFTMNIQYAGPVTTTVFSGVNFTVDSGTITVNAPLLLTNSTFTMEGNSVMTTSYQDSLVNTKIELYGSSSLTATGSAATTISLTTGSEVEIGDGTSASTASFTVSGPTLNLYDTSKVATESTSNIYFNWSNYNSAPSSAGVKTSHTSFNNANANLNMNCGGVNPHACANPDLYGPATLSSAGTVEGAVLLPVILQGFTAELNIDKTVLLNWETSQESNSSHFDIERSQDGSTWTTIGSVQAAGTSDMTIDYTFTDESPATGINYYRLNMVDRDGRDAYSDVKIVRTAALVSKVSFYPNPARDYVNVSLSQASGTEVTIRLINQAGQVLQEKKAVSSNGATVTFPVQQYSTGLYILSVVGADGSHESSKLLISRS